MKTKSGFRLWRRQWVDETDHRCYQNNVETHNFEKKKKQNLKRVANSLEWETNWHNSIITYQREEEQQQHISAQCKKGEFNLHMLKTCSITSFTGVEHSMCDSLCVCVCVCVCVWLPHNLWMLVSHQLHKLTITFFSAHDLFKTVTQRVRLEDGRRNWNRE